MSDDMKRYRGWRRKLEVIVKLNEVRRLQDIRKLGKAWKLKEI